MIIIKKYSFKIVMKLQLKKIQNNSVTYQDLHDHMIVLYQNSELLLDLLLNLKLTLSQNLQIIWFNFHTYSQSHLNFYLQIWKNVILKILQWFKAHNSLYENININYVITDLWTNSFLLKNVLKLIIKIKKNDDKKQMNYAFNLFIYKAENDL